MSFGNSSARAFAEALADLRRRPKSFWLTALIALWALSAMPLLALPVNWADICGCDACPMAGGPSCCCRNFPTWANADGSPGKRAAITHHDIESQKGSCVGPASLSSSDFRTIGPRWSKGEASPPTLLSAFRISKTPAPRRESPLLGALPRPPPAVF